jgi:hypothetical protein
MTAELHRHDFAAHLHSHFDVLDEYAGPGGVACELELVEVSDEARSARQEVFSILLAGPRQHFLPQRTYTLRHPALGEQALFLVPVGQDAGGYQYQAVFNRLIPPAAAKPPEVAEAGR